MAALIPGYHAGPYAMPFHVGVPRPPVPVDSCTVPATGETIAGRGHRQAGAGEGLDAAPGRCLRRPAGDDILADGPARGRWRDAEAVLQAAGGDRGSGEGR